MAKGVNKVILLGNCGKDPDIRYLPDGKAVANVSVATSSWVGKDQPEKTDWHRVVFFGKLAEIVGQYVRKGSQIYVEGTLRYGQYEKDGITRYTTDIIASELQLIGGRSGESSHGGESGAPAESRPSSGDYNARPNKGDESIVDDDIPF